MDTSGVWNGKCSLPALSVALLKSDRTGNIKGKDEIMKRVNFYVMFAVILMMGITSCKPKLTETQIAIYNDTGKGITRIQVNSDNELNFDNDKNAFKNRAHFVYSMRSPINPGASVNIKLVDIDGREYVKTGFSLSADRTVPFSKADKRHGFTIVNNTGVDFRYDSVNIENGQSQYFNITDTNDNNMYNIVIQDNNGIEGMITKKNVNGTNDVVLNLTKDDINPKITILFRPESNSAVDQFYVRKSGTSEWILYKSWSSSIILGRNKSFNFYLDGNDEHDFLLKYNDYLSWGTPRPRDYTKFNITVKDGDTVIFTDNDRTTPVIEIRNAIRAYR